MKYLPIFFALTLLARAQNKDASTSIDACEDTTSWKTFHSAGVEVSQHSDAGFEGRALRFDISFTKGSGYGGVIRNCDLALPDNYELSFLLRATVPVNNFEIKVSNDSAGENIWWVNNRNYTYPARWKRIVVKKRHLSFAWGPHSAPNPDRLRRIELVVTAGSGGGGSVWMDDLRLIPIPMPPEIPSLPTVAASSNGGLPSSPANILTGLKGGWRSKGSSNEWITTDFKYRREFGALRLDWDKRLQKLDYDILGSVDGRAYDTLYVVRKGKGGSVLLYTPESEAQFLKLRLVSNGSLVPFHLNHMSLVPSESLSTANHYFERISSGAPRGYYPRYFSKEASYWTIVGVPTDEREALFNCDGTFEVDKQHFSIEPFVCEEKGQVLTWSNARSEQQLEDGYLPIPTATRIYDRYSVTVKLVADGEPGTSSLLAKYVLKNTSSSASGGEFYLALRPFQVNPTYQWLNVEGGFARTESIAVYHNRAIAADKSVTVSGIATGSGATTIDGGEIMDYIARGTLPDDSVVYDPRGMASAAFQYRFHLRPGDSLVVVAAVPFWPQADAWTTKTPSERDFDNACARQRRDWIHRLNAVRFTLPPDPQRLLDIVRSNLAYILINKDGPGFQPGSRSYERSWIRDGALTSSAILKMGITNDVRDFLDWYSKYQYENGMVPCVVDKRGPDPVPENDSHGEYIFAIAEYFRFSHDTTFLREHWTNIVHAVDYVQSLRQQRMMADYKEGDSLKRACYGLVPESISHEGYSAKPMHSYWDDFFVLKGFKDASYVAGVLGNREQAKSYDSLAIAFRTNLYNSINLAMKEHAIDYIPGCVELGDFDPTSTSISLFPCGELSHVPSEALHRTYDKYFDWFMKRKEGRISWEAFTPYEIRSVGTYVYLGQKERAHTLLEWFLDFQRPKQWNEWAEVAWNDIRAARFIGDMPHTWVGSDFINAFRTMFIYEIGEESSLVLGSGLRDEWILQGLSVEGLPTHYGPISYSIQSSGHSGVIVHIKGSVQPKSASILIPVRLLSRPLISASVDGTPVSSTNGFIRITSLPATVNMQY